MDSSSPIGILELPHDMSRDKYLGMRSGDLDGKPYAKYWNPKMAPMQNGFVASW
jgi:hypothetical protein